MNWKNVLTWALVFLSTLQSAWATNTRIILPHTTATEKEFLRELYEIEGGRRPSDLQWEALPDQARRHNLFELFETAQRQFLDGQLEEAKQTFTKLTEMAYEDDWSSGEQKFIIFSYLRLAQMEQDFIKRRNYVLEAAKWQTKDPIDKNLFPPPLIANLVEMRKDLQKKAQVWRPLIHYPVCYLVLNGKKLIYRPGRRYKIFSGTTRVTLLSDHFEKQSKTLNTSSLFITEFNPTESFVNGNCEAPSVNEDKLPNHDETVVVFPKNCTKFRDADYWVLKEEKPLHPNLKPSVPLVMEKPEIQKESEPFYKKTWFWVVTGVVVVGVVASIQSQNQSKSSGGTQSTQKTAAP